MLVGDVVEILILIKDRLIKDRYNLSAREYESICNACDILSNLKGYISVDEAQEVLTQLRKL